MRLLAIFAHPDDEAYGPGATLARYALTGHEVYLTTLTRGEAGSLGICKTLPPEEIAAMRTKELQCAAKALHLTGLTQLAYPDKHLSEIDDATGVEIIEHQLSERKPDVLITFHEPGISGHPDHTAVSRWCRLAVERAQNPPRFLYYGISPQQAEKVREHRKIIPFREEEITHIIETGDYWPYKLAAIQCHQSQLDLWERFKSFNGEMDYFAHAEHFSQVLPEWDGRQIAREI